MTNSDRKTGPGTIGRQFHIWKKGSDMIHDLWQDTRFAARTLVRRPGYAAAVFLTLVLAVGATTAVFSVVNGVLLHPLPHPKSDELVLVYEVDQRPGFFEDDNPVSAANFRDWNEQDAAVVNSRSSNYLPDRRYSAGVNPVALLNTLVKWL